MTYQNVLMQPEIPGLDISPGFGSEVDLSNIGTVGFTFTDGQKRAVQLISNWYRTMSKNYFVLLGYAGTGKSTIVKYITKQLGIPSSQIWYGTPTGKSAMVLRKKGHPTAATVYSLFYKCTEVDPNIIATDLCASKLIPLEDQPIFGLKDMMVKIQIINDLYKKAPMALRAEINDLLKTARVSLPQNIASTSVRARGMMSFRKKEIPKSSLPTLLVVDETSMLTDLQIADILSYGIPVIFLGDDFQLEPVTGVNTLLKKPDIVLTDIVRTAEDHAVVYAATLAREKGRFLNPGNYNNQFLRVSQEDFFSNQKMYSLMPKVDQIICGKNNSKAEIIAEVRDQLKYDSPLPRDGEKVMCTRNNNELGLVNGMMGTCDGIKFISERDGYMLMSFTDEEGRNYPHLKCSLAPFMPEINDQVYYKKLLSYNQFTFGHAITCHASQGSEYDRVILFEEPFGENPWRWVYTGYTRTMGRLLTVY